ncbi:type III-B CRISPR-associated protein Cas10/Cmr2 [Tolypothrix campylonemoides VB511288]|nr:type III-B CRISPR-associated protein Cas10/Cmr2 [Tolypothrix campylonemoides VB511288]
MNVYHRKLYALLHEPTKPVRCNIMCKQLQCLQEHLVELDTWWWSKGSSLGEQAAEISSSSDRVNLELNSLAAFNNVQVRHPISGESQEITEQEFDIAFEISQIAAEPDVEKVFWWFWRFYPEALASKQLNALLIPAHKILPDCPLHSYKSTVSALVGAMFPEQWLSGEAEHPYLLLFTFSPVQEFIKSSRKFLDFWAGSYLLHYLSVKLCWYIAQTYGPDAVITPSLWSQEIIDALLVQKYPDFAADFACLQDGTDPVGRFQDKKSTSLTTAGFPNVITVLVPGKDAAEALGRKLGEQLPNEWKAIADNVRSDIKKRVMDAIITDEQGLWDVIAPEFPSSNDTNPYRSELQKWKQQGCWEWNKLWDAQIENTWESYWTAVPLGNPDQPLAIFKEGGNFDGNWKQGQEAIAPSRFEQFTPTQAEEITYHTLNVGTWWGNVQSRLGQLIQSVKNTRTWQLPTAPGERSTLSGQFSAVHPQLHYKSNFKEGAGVSTSSMRLFWRVMAEVYPGLFNGSEKLNAIELTKRMAWGYGRVAESLGITINITEGQPDYEGLIRFPNLSSIAAAKFAYENLPQVRTYWNNLNHLIQKNLPEQHQKFGSRTRGRPFHVYKTDAKINPHGRDGQDYNGVMFSSKWLAEDMDLQGKEVETLRGLVEKAHKDSHFGDGSPADWWVIVLADGDGMGKYVSGTKLKEYKHYIVESAIANLPAKGWEELLKTRKRMGPATHVGLNRALLDFSNRLVPYITEQRFCGKVVYSGGDDVMAVLPLEDLPEFLRSLRAAWCGGTDPLDEFESRGGYWYPKELIQGLPNRPYFTMGEGATMSMGIVIAHKSVPLPTVLESLWEAEKERAKKLPGKDGLCFRVIYGGGNTLEAVMKGKLLSAWYELLSSPTEELSPLLLRLAEELPRRATVTENYQLFAQAANVIMARRDESKKLGNFKNITDWLNVWEDWVKSLKPEKMTWKKWIDKLEVEQRLGTKPGDLGNLLRFSAFWVDKMVQRQNWKLKVESKNKMT